MPGGEDEDDPLQMMLNTKKKREQTDEEMRVRVDEDVERMMENGVKINPCASNVETRRLGSGRAGYLRQSRLPAAEPATHGSRRSRACAQRPSGLQSRAWAAWPPQCSRVWHVLTAPRAHLHFHHPGCSAHATARPRAERAGMPATERGAPLSSAAILGLA